MPKDPCNGNVCPCKMIRKWRIRKLEIFKIYGIGQAYTIEFSWITNNTKLAFLATTSSFLLFQNSLTQIWWKCNLIFELIIMNYEELNCHDKYKKVNLKLKHKMPDLPTSPTVCNYEKIRMLFWWVARFSELRCFHVMPWLSYGLCLWISQSSKRKAKRALVHMPQNYVWPRRYYRGNVESF